MVGVVLLVGCGPQVATTGDDESSGGGDTSGRGDTTAGATASGGPTTASPSTDTGGALACPTTEVIAGRLCVDPVFTLSLDGDVRSIASGDFDGDGRDELLIGQPTGLTIAAFDGQELGLTAIDGTADLSGTPSVGDVDGDGDDDVLALRSPIDLLWLPGPSTEATSIEPPLPEPLAIASADGYGLLTVNQPHPEGPTTTTLATFRMGAGALVVDATVDYGGTDWGASDVSSLQGFPGASGTQGAAAIVTMTCDFSHEFSVRIDPDPAAGQSASLVLDVYDPVPLLGGVIRSDGRPSVLVATEDALLHFDVGDGTLDVWNELPVTDAAGLGIGDFDHDGVDDVVAALRGDAHLWFGVGWDGTGAPTAESLFEVDLPTRQVAVGDFDGDGFDDIAVLYASNEVAMWRTVAPE